MNSAAKMTIPREKENNKKRQTSSKKQQQMMILSQISSAMICAKLTKQQIYINTQQQHHSKLCTKLIVARQGNLKNKNNVDYHLSNNVYLKTKKLTACSANYAKQANKRISNIGKTISSPQYYNLLTILLSVALVFCIVFPLGNCFLLEQLINSNSNSQTTGNLASIDQQSGVDAAPAVSPLASAAASAVAAVAGDALSAALSPRQPIVAGDESKVSQNNQSVQKSVVASLSSAVASAAAAGVAAAAHNALQAADGRAPSASSLSTSGSSLQRSLAQAGARHLAMRALSESHNPEVPYNILHNMKKVEHAAPFYGEPGSASRPFVGKASDLRSSLSTTGSSSSVLSSSPLEAFGIKQLSSLIKSPTLRRVVENYGDFASEFRSLLKPLLSPSSSSSSPFSLLTSRKSVASSAGVAPASATPTKALSPFGGSRILRDISIPALLMLLMSAVPGELRPARTRRKSVAALPPAAMLKPQEDILPALLSPNNFMDPIAPSGGFLLAGNQQQMQAIDPMMASASEWQYSSSSNPDAHSYRHNNQQQQHAAQPIQQQSATAGPWQLQNEANKLVSNNQRINAQSSIISRRNGEPDSPVARPVVSLLASLGSKLNKLASASSLQQTQFGSLVAPNPTISMLHDDKSRYYLVSPSGEEQGNGMARQVQQQQQGEQRDVGQLIPQAWKDAMKRTVNNVQQSASSQFNQLSSWVQDKLKAPATNGSNSTLSQKSAIQTSTTNSNNTSLVASASSMISALSNGAMNIFGFNNNNNNNKTSSNSTTRADQSALNDADSPLAHAQKVKASLTGLAGSLVNSLTNNIGKSPQISSIASQLVKAQPTAAGTTVPSLIATTSAVQSSTPVTNPQARQELFSSLMH